MQGVQNQEGCREVQGGAGAAVQGGAGGLHHLHLSKHNIRCREVQAVQAHLRAKVNQLHIAHIFIFSFLVLKKN